MTRRGALAGVALTALSAAACRRAGKDGVGSTPNADPATYLEPPSVARAVRGAGGAIAVFGAAPPSAEVRLRSPSGEAFAATASDDGAWTVTLPPDPRPRMFAFEADDQGRIVHAEGALLALPAPGPAMALARTGFGALVIGDPSGAPHISAIDYDGAGGGAVSGFSPPRTPVQLLVDGRLIASGVSDVHGRFTLLGFDPRAGFSPGEHDLSVVMRSGERSVSVRGRWPVTPAAPLGEQVFAARREGEAFRVDWRIPGGGSQTTVILDPPDHGAAS